MCIAHVRRTAAVVVVWLAVLLPSRAGAQSSSPVRGVAPWGLVDAVGYGGIGVGTSLLLVWDMEFGDAYAVMIGAGVAGTVGGAVLGSRARRNVREGRPTGAAHRAAVLAGAVFAGTTVGALAAAPLINGDDTGTPLGSDETTVGITMLGGTLLGAWYAMKNRDDFDGSRVSVSPFRSRERTAGLRVSVTF